MICLMFFFFKQKTAYEMRSSDWSSDVCSSDLTASMRRCSPSAVSPATRRSWNACRASATPRSEERRGGKECVSTCRSGWSAYNQNTNHSNNLTEKQSVDLSRTHCANHITWPRVFRTITIIREYTQE